MSKIKCHADANNIVAADVKNRMGANVRKKTPRPKTNILSELGVVFQTVVKPWWRQTQIKIKSRADDINTCGQK